MELVKAFIAIVDISGYTRFVRMHKMAVVHAEQIITELMESILDKSEAPLIVDRLMGDAVVFYAVDNGDPENAGRIVKQIQDFFDAFYARERVLVSCNMCVCEACQQIDGLQLKAILHHGDLLLKQMGGSTQLGGEDIIVAHRLLKNHVQGDEYVLMSKAFHDLAGDMAGLEAHAHTEQYDLGPVETVVFYPDPEQAPKPPPPTWSARLAQLWRVESYGFRRLFGSSAAAEFNNLPDAP